MSLLANNCDLYCISYSHNKVELYLPANNHRRTVYPHGQSVLFFTTPAGLVIWTVERHALPLWPLPPKPVPSPQALPWARLVACVHGAAFAHTVFCTKNALCILVTLSKSCVLLRSTKDQSCDMERGTQAILPAYRQGPYAPGLSLFFLLVGIIPLNFHYY